MAVEVLDYQRFSKLRREGDVDEAVLMHLQSMQNLVALLAKQQHQPAKQEEDSALMADATIADFKKLITLFGGSGHARFRRAPAAPPSSQGQHVSGLPDKVRSSCILHDTAQRKQVSDVNLRSNWSCCLFEHGDCVDAHIDIGSVHDASQIAIDRQKGHTCQPFSPFKDDAKVNAHACSVSMNDASQVLHIASADRGNSHAPLHKQLLSPCREGNDDQKHSSTHVFGHARCRDSTAQKLSRQDFPSVCKNTPCQLRQPSQSGAEADQASLVPKTNSSFFSSLSMDGGAGTVSNGKPVISSGRPPLPPKKRKSPEKIEERTMKCHNSGNCHCAKRRKSKTRNIVRVPTIGLNYSDIPADGHSWCKYGEKSSRDPSHPRCRVYYKCSSVRGCPARKHVERASDDPNMLIVTYGREHLHPPIHKVLMASE